MEVLSDRVVRQQTKLAACGSAAAGVDGTKAMTRLTRKPVFVAALALLLFVALGALSAVDAASSVTDDDAAADATEMPNFAKMRVKQLRKVLKDRGQDCVGCVEKQDFVERAREVWHMPVTSGGE